MQNVTDLSSFVKDSGNGLQTLQLAVDGVHCGGCIRKVENGVRALDGVVDARLNFTTRRMTVVWRAGVQSASALLDAVKAAGYDAKPYAQQSRDVAEAGEGRLLLTALAVAGFAAMNIMLLSVSVWAGNVSDITPWQRDFFHWLSAAIAIPAAAYAGQPFFRSAFRALRAGHVNMDVPISLGVTLALGLSVFETIHHAEHAYFDSAVMLLFFLLCGRYFDHAMRRKTRTFAGNLAALKVDYAHRLGAAGEMTDVPVGVLRPGDLVLVRPGERIPADGCIVAGRSRIDDSLVTGETLQREAVIGGAVYAGTQNYGGALTVKVAIAGEGTLIDEIERLLEKAVAARSRYVRLADRAASWYAPVVHSAAALTLVGWLVAGATLHQAVVTAVAVLIITCPCALALAVPVVQVIAAGRLFRLGVLLNSGDAIERLAEADTIVFDKTGTLTMPEPRIANAAEVPADLLTIAARLAQSSSHPLAAIVAKAEAGGGAVADAVEVAGEGVRANVDGVEVRLGSPAFCGVAEERAGSDEATSRIAVSAGGKGAILQVRQVLRPDAAATVARLRGLGVGMIVLSGDRAGAVRPVAEALGISHWRADCRPADKVAALDALKAEGRHVLMVGDGLNDSPALAAAHVSLAPVGAADLSKSHSDAVFLGERLGPVADAVQVSRQARRLMRQNLGLAVIYNIFAVPIAVAGLVTPLIAALAMSGSSVLVTLNAMRLFRPARAEGAAASPTLVTSELATWTS